MEQFAATSMWPDALVQFFLPEAPLTAKASTLISFALFLGCAGKSAQIPLYVWLPDAMAGPTPVSALIHAATMVTAGVYLVARMSDVFVLSPAAMAVVAIVGAPPAIFAASMGFFQRDLKKVLAYSTVSQLGFMFIGVGVGAFSAGFFHVFTHAFFKACLFLGAGSVIHAMHARIHDTDASQDMWNMGGLRKYMPITHATYLISCLSIAGVPLFAGFWSKDEILWKAYSSQIVGPANRVPPADMGFMDLMKRTEFMWQWPAWLGPAIYWVGIIGATMTAFYMFRSYFLTFWGDFRGWKIVPGWKDPNPHHAHDDDHAHDDHAHAHHEKPGEMDGPVPHESPLPMTVPLMVLGAFALVAGFLGAEPIHVAPLMHKLEPIFARANTFVGLRAGVEAHGAQMWTMMAPGVAAFAGGSLRGLRHLQAAGRRARAQLQAVDAGSVQPHVREVANRRAVRRDRHRHGRRARGHLHDGRQVDRRWDHRSSSRRMVTQAAGAILQGDAHGARADLRRQHGRRRGRHRVLLRPAPRARHGRRRRAQDDGQGHRHRLPGPRLHVHVERARV
jgi:NADH-quinone oxidoreductase subunit L